MRKKKNRGLARKLRAAKKRLFGVIANDNPLSIEDFLWSSGCDIPFVELGNAPRYSQIVPQRNGTRFICDDMDPRYPAMAAAIRRGDTEELTQLLTGHL